MSFTPSPWPGLGMTLSGILLMVSAQAGAGPQQLYEVEEKRSRLVVHLLKAGVASRFAHDHLVRARWFQGRLTMTRGDLSTSRIELTVDTKSLEADAPALRRRYGMKTMLSNEDRAKVLKNLRAKDQLFVVRFPTIRFTSTAFAPTERQGRYRVTGKLTIRGKTRPVTLDVSLRQEGVWIKGSGRLSFLQSNFGYKPYSAGLGLVKVRDRATLNIYLEARLKEGP